MGALGFLISLMSAPGASRYRTLSERGGRMSNMAKGTPRAGAAGADDTVLRTQRRRDYKTLNPVPARKCSNPRRPFPAFPAGHRDGAATPTPRAERSIASTLRRAGDGPLPTATARGQRLQEEAAARTPHLAGPSRAVPGGGCRGSGAAGHTQPYLRRAGTAGEARPAPG